MIEKTIYIAEDGERFETKEDCLNHEKRLESYKIAIAIRDFCSMSSCESCPFYRHYSNRCFFIDNPKAPTTWNLE